MKTSDHERFMSALTDLVRQPSYYPNNPAKGGLSKPIIQSGSGAIRISNIISNDIKYLFEFMSREQVYESTVMDTYLYDPAWVRTAGGDYIKTTPLFEQWYHASFQVQLFEVTATNLPDWLLRLRLLTSLDIYPFTDDDVPVLPSIHQLSQFLGLEISGFKSLDNEEFIENLILIHNRNIAHDLQQRINNTLPNEKYLPFDQKE